MNSMLADVCDVDELRSGHRREAFYGAVFVTCDKIAMGVAMLLQGFLLKASGFDAKQAVQSVETIETWMRWLLMTQPAGFILGMIVIFFYPLSKARLLAIRAELDARTDTRNMKLHQSTEQVFVPGGKSGCHGIYSVAVTEVNERLGKFMSHAERRSASSNNHGQAS
jgi:Na+/melibiose symporter-like transporter